MKISVPKTVKEANDILSRLCHCHDGSIKRISFVKDRALNEDGNLVYPFGDMKDAVYCDVEVELLLNSYEGAKKDQVVVFAFERTDCFNFRQAKGIDYSDMQEVTCDGSQNSRLEFRFYAGEARTEVISLTCQKVLFKEL